MLDVSMCLKKILTWITSLAMYSGLCLSAHNFLYRSQRHSHLSAQCQMYGPSARSGVWIRKRWTSREGIETLLRVMPLTFRHFSVNDRFRDNKGTCLELYRRQVPLLSL